jgi:hypothetical protein
MITAELNLTIKREIKNPSTHVEPRDEKRAEDWTNVCVRTKVTSKTFYSKVLISYV